MLLILNYTQIETNASQQESKISEFYERPDKEYLQKSPKLQTQIDGQKMVQLFLPRQTDIDEILKIIQMKVL